MLHIFEMTKMVKHSGPGYRTLVHFKGCPLRCIWCSTPESQSFKDELGYNENRCIGCGSCENICSEHAITVTAGKAVINRKKCITCLRCVDECVTEALKGYVHDWEPEELVAELLKDAAFFANSKGGITFSGGEPLWADTEDLIKVMKRLKEHHIHIGMDTTGYAQWDTIQKLLPYIDFFLWDIKHMDSEIHRRLTGVDNHLILDNLKKVDACGTDLYIRVPLIPDMTASEENVRQICEFATTLSSVVEIDFMPFHTLGRQRYTYSGKVWKMDQSLEQMSKEEVKPYVRLAESYGLKAEIIA